MVTTGCAPRDAAFGSADYYQLSISTVISVLFVVMAILCFRRRFGLLLLSRQLLSSLNH